MARSLNLQNHVAAIARAALIGVCGVLAMAAHTTVAAQNQGDDAQSDSHDSSSKPWYDERLRAFFVVKEKQAHELDGTPAASGEVWQYFDAGTNGDWSTTTNLYNWMRQHARRYGGKPPYVDLDKVWPPVLETELARLQFASSTEKYFLAYGNDIIQSVPAGSIYFGGTDPGRGVITVMQESQVGGKPFFTLTQNALADITYDDYLQAMYGEKIYICSQDDLSGKISEYSEDLKRRYLHDNNPAKTGEPRQLKPGEGPVKKADNTFEISGQVSVMAINGLLAKVIFDKNPTREFYVEESFPLDWMYPHLIPNGLIMKINRQPLDNLSAEIVRQDHEYWFRCLQPMIGDWLHDETPVADVTQFAERVCLKHDLAGFTGDREFVEDTWAQKSYAKLRSSLAGVYAWRAGHGDTLAEKQRMTREADFAYRQAFALCPTSPEVVFGYAQLLINSKRADDALLVVGTALDFDSTNISLQNLMQGLRDSKAAR